MSTADAVRAEETLPRDNGELVFDAPWQARAFAVAVAMTEAGAWEWDAFRSRLVAEIDAWEDADGAARDPWDYYARWAAALEAVLVDTGTVDPGELDAVQARLAQAAAHEHDHDEPHDHDHAHDHDHDPAHHRGAGPDARGGSAS